MIVLPESQNHKIVFVFAIKEESGDAPTHLYCVFETRMISIMFQL